MEGSQPARPAEPGTLKASLLSTPRIQSLTEGVSAHPSIKQLERLTQAVDGLGLDQVSPSPFRASFSPYFLPSGRRGPSPREGGGAEGGGGEGGGVDSN